MRVSVIIPAWNLWQMTAACLRSLATHSAGQDLEVLVVDNGSTDATVGELEPLGQSLWGAGFKALRLPETWVSPRPAIWGRAPPQANCFFSE